MLRNFVNVFWFVFVVFVPYKIYWVIHSKLRIAFIRINCFIFFFCFLNYWNNCNTFSRRKKESSFFPRSWRGTNEIKTSITFDIKVVIAVNVLSRSVYFMAQELRPPTIKMGCLNFLLLILCYTFNTYHILLIGFLRKGFHSLRGFLFLIQVDCNNFDIYRIVDILKKH